MVLDGAIWRMEIVSRTRCGVLHAAPQSRDPFKDMELETWAPDQQRTPPQKGRRAAQPPGNAAYTDLVRRSALLRASRRIGGSQIIFHIRLTTMSGGR